MTWANGRQLSSVITGSGYVGFAYNADGRRLYKTDGTNETIYLVVDGVAVGESINNGQTTILYLFDESGNVYGINVNGYDYFFRKNLQGDVVGIWDPETGDQIVTYTYDPWGKLLTVTDTTNIGVGTLNPFRYRSYYYDIETGLYYLQSRYYDPETGRFVNADGQLNTGDFLGLNQFTYCNNNPVLLEDSSGTRPTRCMTVKQEEAMNRKRILYDVPFYKQNHNKTCWASCQMMVNDYYSGKDYTETMVRVRTVSFAKSTCAKDDNWNRYSLPTNTNIMNEIDIITIYDLHDALAIYGPIYAGYKGVDSEGNEVAHLVVVTGVDVQKDIVYTNDPSALQPGKQSFREFLSGSYNTMITNYIRYDNKKIVAPLSKCYYITMP